MSQMSATSQACSSCTSSSSFSQENLSAAESMSCSSGSPQSSSSSAVAVDGFSSAASSQDSSATQSCSDDTLSSQSSECSTSSSGSSESEDQEEASHEAWELCCSQRSMLTRMAAQTGLRCRRFTLPDFDLSLAETSDQLVGLVHQKPPKWLWISTPCTAYSPCQNMRKKKNTRKSRRVLARKRLYSDKIVHNALRPAKAVVRKGRYFYYECLVFTHISNE